MRNKCGSMKTNKVKACCKVMDAQLNYDCPDHGKGSACPDVIVGISSSKFFEGELVLFARNAEYSCYYCPWCGHKWDSELYKEENDE